MNRNERRKVKGQESNQLRFVAVSNRLPVTLYKDGDGWGRYRGAGGLVTALSPVLRNRGGSWIGWPGTSEAGDFTDLMEEVSLEGDTGCILFTYPPAKYRTSTTAFPTRSCGLFSTTWFPAAILIRRVGTLI